MSPSQLALLLATTLSLAPAVKGHMSMFLPSMYGVGPAPGFSYEYWDPVVPLGPGWMNRDEWWFRGPESRKLKPKEGEVTALPAGGNIMIEMACHVAWTQYGSSTTVPGSKLDACPGNSGAYHSGEPGADDVDLNMLSGCALAIADVDDIEKVTMDNLAVFSVQQKCVAQKQTFFDIPAAMPACTGSKCICGWFWLANNGTANFYMTAFDCKVTGATGTAKIAAPVDPKWCPPGDKGCANQTGAKRPLYAYNYPSNIQWKGNHDRPGYHDNWNFKQGAQNDIFEIDEAAAAAASSSSAAHQASVASELQASMAAQLSSRRAQGHVPPPATTTAAPEWTPIANANTGGGGVVGAVTSAVRAARTRKVYNNRSKRHARDFELEERDDDEWEEADGPFPTAMPQVAEQLGKRCSGLDHGCDMTEEELFKA